MALEGSLKDFGLADILQLIQIQRKTGSLTMKNPSMQARILFENGMVVTATNSDMEGLDKIGEVLLRAERITEEQLDLALQAQRQTGEKIGETLIKMGAIPKEDIVKALNLQVKEIVFSLFRWKEGQYSFEAGEVSYEADYCHPIHTEFILMEGVRRVDEWPFIEKKIPNREAILEKNEANADRIQGIKAEEEESLDNLFGDAGGDSPQAEGIQLTQEEMNIYNLVDGRHEIGHIIEISQMGEFEACKAISSLLTADLVRQSASSSPPAIRSSQTKAEDGKASWLTGINIRSGIVMLLTGIVLIMGLMQMNRLGQYAADLSGIYKSMKLQNQLRGVGFSVQNFYYVKGELPADTRALLSGGYIEEGMLEDPWGREIGYEVSGGEFRIGVW